MKHHKHRRQAILKRIKRRIVKDPITDCWIWTGPTSGNGRGGGYGRMSLNDRTVATHVVVYTHYYGYIPGNREVDHICRNRLCCNPEHLRLVTRSKNEKAKCRD